MTTHDPVAGEEVWADIAGHESRYSVSNTGRVYSKRKGRMVARLSRDGRYEQVMLWHEGEGKGHYVHRLVASAFVPADHLPPGRAVVNHKNGDKRDNRATNLEWSTYADNNLHAIDRQLRKAHITPAVVVRDLTWRERQAIALLSSKGVPHLDLCTAFLTSTGVIQDVIRLRSR